MLSFFYLLTLGPYISLCNTRKPKMQLNYDMVLLITDPYKATIFEECFYWRGEGEVCSKFFLSPPPTYVFFSAFTISN